MASKHPDRSGQSFIIRALRWLWHYGIILTLFALVFTAIVPGSTLTISDVWDAIAHRTSRHHFDFVRWEVNAIGSKAQQVLFGQHAYMTAEARTDFVRAYVADLQRLQALNTEITAIYSDPTVTEPQRMTADQQAERDQLRADLDRRQPLAEAILEGQVAAVLVDEGFGVAGQLWPPMAMRFTGMPNLLVTSPRDTIRMENSLVIDPMPVDEIAALEAQIAADYDVAAIVVPLGGIALYPAMIHESASISFIVETFAHEWLHHYLYFHPLGISYFTGDGFAGEARIINETTADLFGKAVAQKVLARYYPDITPPALPQPDPDPTPQTETDPDAFEFAAEMHITRTRVDDLLAAGDVEAAEAYMAERQRFFFENGYRLRVLNQAFFAFYGGYQAGGGIAGAGGQDPIGPAVIRIYHNSASIQGYVHHLRGITTRQQLLALDSALASAAARPNG